MLNRSAVPTYDLDYTYAGQYFYPSNYSPSFLSIPGATAFEAQQGSYWAQKAVHTADINFTWWPPSNSTYTHKNVTVLTSCVRDTGSVFGNGGCWEYDLYRDSDETTGCICLQSKVGYGATEIGDIFHESGHAIDWKYLGGGSRSRAYGNHCDPNTAEEGNSLAEAIAILYAMTMFVQEWGTSTPFTDYDAVTPTVEVHSPGWFDGLGTVYALEGVVHTDDDNVVCHAPHNTCGGSAPCKTWRPSYSPATLPTECNGTSNQPYWYAAPLLQAYWEVVHARNCDGPGACYLFNDGAGSNQARWALFYAMKNTPGSGTYWDFVANFLTYFYYDVGSTQWNNRWWVFNHHRLVGADYGYSPCHVY